MLWILDGLRQDHANLATLLEVLERQLDAFAQGERPDYDIVRGVVDYCLGYPDAYHHPREDLVYDKLLIRDPASIEAIGNLREEHKALAEVTADFAAVVGDVLDEQQQVPRHRLVEAGRLFLDAYRNHMARENEVIFPVAQMALKAEDWAEIALSLQDPGDPLFGKDFDRRFEALRRSVLVAEKENSG